MMEAMEADDVPPTRMAIGPRLVAASNLRARGAPALGCPTRSFCLWRVA
jgi:hypothetical protein